MRKSGEQTEQAKDLFDYSITVVMAGDDIPWQRPCYLKSINPILNIFCTNAFVFTAKSICML